MKIRTISEACLVACLTLFCFSQAIALSAGDRILDEISFSGAENYTMLTVSFNFPVKYLRHFPINNGKEIHIQFEPIITSKDNQVALNKREILLPTGNNPVGVTRVVYEGSEFIKPTIRVIFDKAVFFDAKQGADYRSLAVLIPTKVKTDVLKPSVVRKKADVPANPGQLTVERQKELLHEGVQVIAEKNYSRAVQVYTKLLESNESKVLEMAQYQLALAQEKIGHMAHAKAEYKIYLRTYPEGNNATEARIHLKRLLSAHPKRPGQPTDVSEKQESAWESDFFGSISVFYDRDESFYEDNDADKDEENSIVNFSTATTDIDATWLLQNDKYKFEVVAIGSFEGDLEDDDHETRASALYIDFEDDEKTIETRLGRQSSSKGGVLGRFDGASLGYLLTEKFRMNLVAGYPVDISSDDPQSDKYFYGINFDLGRFWNHWDFNTYFINQVADDIDDRRAIGTEVRYIGSSGSFMSLIDYDLLFEQVNIFIFSGNYLLPKVNTQVYMSADFRRSPSLSSSNALIGQISPSLKALEASLGETELRNLAQDRSLDSSFVTFGISHPLSDTFQIAADVSWSELDDAPASGGVDMIDSTGDEFFYSLQLLTNGTLTTGDVTSYSLRYADTKQRDTYSLIFNSRYPISQKLRINSKLQIDYRENKSLPGEQWRLRPNLRIEYLLCKNLTFEIEGEYSWADEELEGVAEDREGYLVSAGFRWYF